MSVREISYRCLNSANDITSSSSCVGDPLSKDICSARTCLSWVETDTVSFLLETIDSSRSAHCSRSFCSWTGDAMFAGVLVSCSLCNSNVQIRFSSL